jgi:hypothetical protein
MRAKLTDVRTGMVLLDDCGLHAGCEVMDAMGELAKGVWRPKPSAG